MVKAKPQKASRNNRGSTPDKSSDEWRTPLRLYRAIQQHLGVFFIADMAAAAENALAPCYFDKDYDTLAQPAEDIVARILRAHPNPDPRRHALFCNPPYGSTGLEPWLLKARQVSTISGLAWVNLLPASRTEQDFFYALAPAEYRLDFLRRRADYLRANGLPGGRPNHPSMLMTLPGRNSQIIGGTFGHLEWRDA
jgi:hypothetical protein